MIQRAAATCFLLGVVGVPVACSGSDETADFSDDSGLVFDDGVVDGGPIDGEPQNGGTIPLTSEQVEAIQTAECTGWNGEGEELPAVLQLVVDVSGSMSEDAPGAPRNTSKWQVTRSALVSALESLDERISVGLLLYPNVGNRGRPSQQSGLSCIDTSRMIPIAPLGQANSGHRATLLEALDEARVGDYTPTHDAYEYALENSLEPYQTSAKKFMLLITDGAPTYSRGCSNRSNDGVPPGPIIDAIATANDAGTSTFLIGSPGSESSVETGTDMRPWLSEAALEGGTGSDGCNIEGPQYCHFDMTAEPDFAAALTAGLGKIAGQVSETCTYKVPTPPAGRSINPYATNVIVRWSDGSSSLILRDDDTDCGEGWMKGDGDNIILCPTTCEQVKTDGRAAVTLSFGCAADEVPITK